MAGLRKGLMVEGCTNGPDLQPFPSPLLGHFAVPFAERGYRHILFYCASQILNFYKLKVCDNPVLSKSVDTIFPNICSLWFQSFESPAYETVSPLNCLQLFSVRKGEFFDL